jgi:hypothetical protein
MFQVALAACSCGGHAGHRALQVFIYVGFAVVALSTLVTGIRTHAQNGVASRGPSARRRHTTQTSTGDEHRAGDQHDGRGRGRARDEPPVARRRRARHQFGE